MPARTFDGILFASSVLLPTYRGIILPDHDSNGKAAVSWKAASIFILCLVLNPLQRGGRVNAGKMIRQAKGK